MIRLYTNLSPTTRLLIQSFLSITGSVLAGVAAAAYQSYTQAGHLDVQALLNISLLTFALLFGKAMHDWVPAHAQQLLQATNDEKVALYNALQRQQNISQAVIATQGKQVQSVPSAQPVQPVQPVQQQLIATSLNAGDIAAISQQLALNLMNMSTPAQPTATQAQQAPALSVVPVQQDAYIDPLKVSAVLPAYRSPVVATAISEQPTQKVALP